MLPDEASDDFVRLRPRAVDVTGYASTLATLRMTAMPKRSAAVVVFVTNVKACCLLKTDAG